MGSRDTGHIGIHGGEDVLRLYGDLNPSFFHSSKCETHVRGVQSSYFWFCYLIVIAAVSLATFVASLMVFLLESSLQEGIPLH